MAFLRFRYRLQDHELIRKIAQLKRELNNEVKEGKKLRKQVQDLQCLKDSVSQWLTPGMMKRAQGGKRTRYADDDIAAAISLRNAGPRMYRLLRKRGCPLPGVSTLQRWAQRVCLAPGIIKQVIPVIIRSAKTTLDRLCVLSFDEVKVREEVDYIRMNDTVILAKRYAQVVMVRGLTKNWKQIIYYDFDANMTGKIINDVINELEKNGLLVVATVSDLGPTNQACFNQLGVNYNNPTFKTQSGRDVFVFCDTPHLLKCARNHFVDKGFLYSGKTYSVQPVLDLLARDTGDLRICPRITLDNVKVVKAARQKVKHAARLFSQSLSTALLHHGGPEAELTAKLLKLVNDWFDVFNSQAIRKDARKRLHAFGLAMEVQLDILNRATEFFKEARVVGKSSMQPFQKGIIMNNKALPLLLESLRQYKVEFILTRRLNQDCLESIFGVIRSRGGLHDHPSPKEFSYRLRNCILGKNLNNLKNIKRRQLKYISCFREVGRYSTIGPVRKR